VISLVWKTDAAMDDESAKRESDEGMTVCYQEESEQDRADRIKKEADSTGKVMNIKNTQVSDLRAYDSLK